MSIQPSPFILSLLRTFIFSAIDKQSSVRCTSASTMSPSEVACRGTSWPVLSSELFLPSPCAFPVFFCRSKPISATHVLALGWLLPLQPATLPPHKLMGVVARGISLPQLGLSAFCNHGKLHLFLNLTFFFCFSCQTYGWRMGRARDDLKQVEIMSKCFLIRWRATRL